jgi:hypothetical protein
MHSRKCFGSKRRRREMQAAPASEAAKAKFRIRVKSGPDGPETRLPGSPEDGHHRVGRLVRFVPKGNLSQRDPVYSLLAVQRPIQPSARLYEPLPVLPDILPVAVSATPSSPTLAEL